MKRKRYTEEQITGILKALGEQFPRYGYLLLHAMLRTEGLVKNQQAHLSSVHAAGHAGSHQAA